MTSKTEQEGESKLRKSSFVHIFPASVNGLLQGKGDVMYSQWALTYIPHKIPSFSVTLLSLKEQIKISGF